MGSARQNLLIGMMVLLDSALIIWFRITSDKNFGFDRLQRERDNPRIVNSEELQLIERLLNEAEHAEVNGDWHRAKVCAEDHLTSRLAK